MNRNYHPGRFLFLIFTLLVALDTLFLGELYNYSLSILLNFDALNIIFIFLFSSLGIFDTYILFEFIKKVDSLRRSIKEGKVE